MSFYQNQDNARRKTWLLVFYFCTAVILIIAAVNSAIYFTLILASDLNMPPLQWLQNPICWGIAGLTLLAITAGSLMRLAQLSKGGLSVAMMAGGTPLDPATSEPKERMLLNVVEEMAIASGTSVPRVFILREEPAINAFVAGTEPRNTVLAVTKGTLEKLNREELQGVIGHEFSHILNGDMKLNVRLIGILAGILFIGQIGEFLLRGQSRRRYYGSRSSKDGNQLIPIGLALMAIGYVGLFFGRLIKAAISRQREFLADASSVQFTRNPDGIASALYAIQHYSGHSLLMSAHAEDMNHMCFGETVKMQLSGLLATHPPIEDRIRSIDKTLLPRLKARFRKREPADTEHAPNASAPHPATASFAAQPTAQQLKASVGQPTPEHYEYAQQLHLKIPAAINTLAHQTDSAETILYALLLLESSEQQPLPAAIPQRAQQLSQTLKQCSPQIRLPLLDICLGTLKAATREHRQSIIRSAIELIKVDMKITLSEFVYCYLIQHALSEIKRPPRTIKSYRTLEPDLASLFSALVQVSGDTPDKQSDNFRQIMQYYSNKDYSTWLQQPPTPKMLNRALQQLNRLAPLLKQPVVDACVDCILHDNKATVKEMELLRAICEALECPLPPILICDDDLPQ